MAHYAIDSRGVTSGGADDGIWALVNESTTHLASLRWLNPYLRPGPNSWVYWALVCRVTAAPRIGRDMGRPVPFDPSAAALDAAVTCWRLAEGIAATNIVPLVGRQHAGTPLSRSSSPAGNSMMIPLGDCSACSAVFSAERHGLVARLNPGEGLTWTPEAAVGAYGRSFAVTVRVPSTGKAYLWQARNTAPSATSGASGVTRTLTPGMFVVWNGWDEAVDVVDISDMGSAPYWGSSERGVRLLLVDGVTRWAGESDPVVPLDSDAPAATGLAVYRGPFRTIVPGGTKLGITRSSDNASLTWDTFQPADHWMGYLRAHASAIWESQPDNGSPYPLGTNGSGTTVLWRYTDPPLVLHPGEGVAFARGHNGYADWGEEFQLQYDVNALVDWSPIPTAPSSGLLIEHRRIVRR